MADDKTTKYKKNKITT